VASHTTHGTPRRQSRLRPCAAPGGIALCRLSRAWPPALRAATTRWLTRERRAPGGASARRRDPHTGVSVCGALSRLPPVVRGCAHVERQAPAEHLPRAGVEPLRPRR